MWGRLIKPVFCQHTYAITLASTLASTLVRSAAGQARLSRLLHKLKVTEIDRHAELLLAVASASPAMAADYLSSCVLNLEPKASSSRWLVGMTLVGQLVQAAAKASEPFQALING